MNLVQIQTIYILWGGQLDAVAATIFATELRRVGLSARLIGMHARPIRSPFGIVIAPDLSLDNVLMAPDPIACLIIPGGWADLRALLYDPRLLALIERVHRQDGLVFVGGHPDDSPEIEVDRRLLFYPLDGGLLSFAQDLAQSLLMTDSSRFASSMLPVVPEPVQRFFARRAYRSGDHPMGELIRVAADSQPTSVAGAIANTIRQHRYAEVQAIGVNAVNNMMKASIIARRYLAENKLDLLFVPDFTQVVVDTKHLTALKLHVWAAEMLVREDGHRGSHSPS